ncbi:MAG TPA: DUF6796 family protein [Gammaproteobacteria bacterium]|nr:DUF6796 family protein [Gammaproteobacteria bacterium]
MNRNTILVLGIVATVGGILAVAADWYSVWTGQHAMDTAFSVSLAGVLDTFVAKSPGDMEIGSYLGFYFIPLHGVGLYLVYVATRPASRALSAAVLTGGLYVTALGTAVHASLVYVGIVSRAGDPASIDAMARFFDVAAYSMVVLILVFSIGLSILVLSGRSLYPRSAFFVSPMGLMLVSTALLLALPEGARDVKEFIAIAGFNLPVTIFHAFTTVLLLRSSPRLR